MDHLSLPVDELAHAPLEVPYVCNEIFTYDFRGFHTYPSRVGVDVSRFYSIPGREVNTDWNEWAPFLQAWLWFGLLAESFGLESDSVSRTDASDHQRFATFAPFLKTKSDGSQVVTTKDLYSYAFEAMSKTKKLPIFGTVDSCVSMLNSSMAGIISTSSWQKQLARSRKEERALPVVYRVLLSVQILAETLIATRNTLHQAQISVPSKKGTHDQLQLGSDLVDILLEEAGWCKFLLAKLPRQLRVRYFLSYIIPFDAREHISCSRAMCKARPPELPIPYFEPVHTSKDCACSSVSIAGADIEPILQKGDIPVLTFAEISRGERRLEITSAQRHDAQRPQSHFVAISHVRHTGLGNLGKQALPYCQLASIQLIANDLSHSNITIPTNSLPTPFWIDTLCLPIQRSSRFNALRHVREVYRCATKVVVLDPSLYQRSVASFEDCIIRIRYSAWKQRLWTLQEGILARELYIKFRNRSYQLDEIIKGYEQSEPISKFFFQIDPAGIGNNSWLESALDDFDNDIKTAREQDGAFDWYKLQKMLRLGYLALDRYRYFCEEDETEDSIVIVELLERMYKNSPEPIDQVVKRLRLLEAVELRHSK